tara:strand:- start:333 stop:821 length:489 start_codon:yes stop_codon:yes gene_type:complete
MILLNNNEVHHIGQPFIPEIEGAAFRLAHLNRFNGSVGTYSVAQHCCLVASVLPPELRLSGLLHDLCEAYLGDMASPLKKHVKDFQPLEDLYCDVIDKYFDVETRHPSVRAADLRMLITEAKSFGKDLALFPDADAYDFSIERWSPAKAEASFLTMFRTLTR